MYQALYRKYRPQTFDDVIGQKHITESLKNQVLTGRLSHAYIFIGTRGTGKTTCARILAKAVNCEHSHDGNPCCECSTCRGITDGSVMDVVELDAASNNGVDNVRALRDEAIFSPANAKKRVYIIDEVHMLSTPAFNALLKILEEPPEHLIFVLATTELQKVPATILSRCQRHVFKRISTEELSSYLETIASKEGINLDHDAATLLAGLGEGSVRDAMSMLDQCSSYGKIGVDEVYSAVGLAGNKRITSLFEAITDKNAEQAVNVFDTMWKDGKDPSIVLKEISNLARDILMMKVAPKSATSLIYGGYDLSVIQDFADRLTINELCYIGDEIVKTLSNLNNPKLNAELCIIKLASVDVISSEPVQEVKAASRPATRPQHISNEQVKAVHPENMVNSDNNTEFPAPQKNEAVQRVAEDKINDSPSHVLTGDKSDFWNSITSSVKNDLPMDLSLLLNNDSVVAGFLEGDVLNIRVVPGFYFARFSKPENIAVFTEAAGKICGKPVTVRFSEMKEEDKKPLHDLDELKNFPEVTFI